MHYVLTPAYGRQYASSGEVVEDYNRGKDFVLNSPRGHQIYCSCRDFDEDDTIELRWGNGFANLTIVGGRE